ncbi:heme binding [Homalodisca vitripennis]|nr:heme binding [Homalodisca vitripennis]
MEASLSDFSVLSVLVTAALVCLTVYFWKFTQWHYWKQRGVPYLKPVLPIFGNMYDLLKLRSLPDISNRIYKETKGLPYVGIYACHTPVLFVRDLDLITKILVNDFNHFEDRGFNFNVNDILGRNLIHQKGSDWRFSRSKLVSCFGVNKVKAMFPTMKSKSEVLEEILKQEDTSCIDIWEASLRYTTDVITSCTIGVDANSLQKQDEQFRLAGSHMLGSHFIYHVFMGCFFPRLHRILGIAVAKDRVKRFFQTVIHQVINYRKDNKSNNKDIIQTLIQLKEESSVDQSNKIPEIDDNFIVAQSFIFFLAGFESPGNVLACALYEVAKQPHIQDTLCQEIHSVLDRYGGEVTFDALQDMKFLRQVVSEALRKYTPLTLIFRRCTKDYTIPDTSTVIEKGTLVLIPLRSIHEDPDYYPDPEVFDPERFSDENSASRHAATYMPFGVGPRFCPAVLYSHIKIRTAMVNLLRQFEVCVTKETPACLQPSPLAFLMAPKNGIPLAFKKR